MRTGCPGSLGCSLAEAGASPGVLNPLSSVLKSKTVFPEGLAPNLANVMQEIKLIMCVGIISIPTTEKLA